MLLPRFVCDAFTIVRIKCILLWKLTTENYYRIISILRGRTQWMRTAKYIQTPMKSIVISSLGISRWINLCDESQYSSFLILIACFYISTLADITSEGSTLWDIFWIDPWWSSSDFPSIPFTPFWRVVTAIKQKGQVRKMCTGTQLKGLGWIDSTAKLTRQLQYVRDLLGVLRIPIDKTEVLR